MVEATAQKTVEIPAEVQKKKQPKKMHVYEKREDMEAAHPEVKRLAAEKAKEKGRKRIGGGKQFRVNIKGKDWFTIANGAKDAYARVCKHVGIEVERLDAEAREPRTIKSSFEDVLAQIAGDQKMPAQDRQKLTDQLKKLQAAAADK